MARGFSANLTWSCSSPGSVGTSRASTERSVRMAALQLWVHSGRDQGGEAARARIQVESLDYGAAGSFAQALPRHNVFQQRGQRRGDPSYVVRLRKQAVTVVLHQLRDTCNPGA